MKKIEGLNLNKYIDVSLFYCQSLLNCRKIDIFEFVLKNENEYSYEFIF